MDIFSVLKNEKVTKLDSVYEVGADGKPTNAAISESMTELSDEGEALIRTMNYEALLEIGLDEELAKKLC